MVVIGLAIMAFHGVFFFLPLLCLAVIGIGYLMLWLMNWPEASASERLTFMQWMIHCMIL